jgi:methylated-DNA-[protein]-cysteine S-methyltransferase
MCQHRGRPADGPPASWQRDDAALQAVRDQLKAYFNGRLHDFELPLRMVGTPFQHLVWEGLRAIPYGETVSYAELAIRIGRPGASRAVGSANGRNPISIVVPCHRVIAADGTLGGYGGGLDRKEWLLQHELAFLEQTSVTPRQGRRVAMCLSTG